MHGFKITTIILNPAVNRCVFLLVAVFIWALVVVFVSESQRSKLGNWKWDMVMVMLTNMCSSTRLVSFCLLFLQMPARQL